MDNFKYAGVADCLEYARDRISFLAQMFSMANPKAFDLDEHALCGLVQTLWGINDILDKAEEFLNQQKAKSDLE